jgi:hypothetical protein
MTYYTIDDLMVGETGDPNLPAFIAIGDNIIKATYGDYGLAAGMFANQKRRFGRQQQLIEKGDLSNVNRPSSKVSEIGGSDD